MGGGDYGFPQGLAAVQCQTDHFAVGETDDHAAVVHDGGTVAAQSQDRHRLIEIPTLIAGTRIDRRDPVVDAPHHHHAGFTSGRGHDLTADATTPALFSLRLIQGNQFGFRRSNQHQSNRNTRPTTDRSVGVRPPEALAGQAIEGLDPTLRVCDEQRITLHHRANPEMLSVQVGDRGVPQGLDRERRLELHQFCRRIGIILGKKAATTGKQEGDQGSRATGVAWYTSGCGKRQVIQFHLHQLGISHIQGQGLRIGLPGRTQLFFRHGDVTAQLGILPDKTTLLHSGQTGGAVEIALAQQDTRQIQLDQGLQAGIGTVLHGPFELGAGGRGIALFEFESRLDHGRQHRIAA